MIVQWKLRTKGKAQISLRLGVSVVANPGQIRIGITM